MIVRSERATIDLSDIIISRIPVVELTVAFGVHVVKCLAIIMFVVSANFSGGMRSLGMRMETRLFGMSTTQLLLMLLVYSVFLNFIFSNCYSLFAFGQF